MKEKGIVLDIKTIIKNLIVGTFIGISNVIPGVSGGTIACVFDSYENMLSLPSLNIKRIKKEYQAIFSLYFGIALGVLAFSKLVNFVYKHYPVYTAYFFVGIIFGSLFFLYTQVSEKQREKNERIEDNNNDSSMKSSSNKKTYNKHLKKAIKVFFFVCGFSIMLSLYIFKRLDIILPFYWDASSGYLSFYFVLFIYCAIASAGMIIPGISGSFLLLLLGAYAIVIEAVASFNLKLLLIIGSGVLFGLLISARLVKFLIERFRSFSYAFILGLTVGSIMNIFPIVCQPFNQRFISAMMLLAGYVIVTIFTGRNIQKN